MPSSLATECADLRLAILNRRFWPISNSAEMEVAWLSVALAERGCDVDVLTVRWQKFWPERSVYRGASVVRLPKPLSGPFGKYRFNKHLVAYLIKHRYDGLIAFGLGEDTCSAAIGLGGELPVVLRITSDHLSTIKVFGKRELAALAIARKIMVDRAEVATTLARHFVEGGERDEVEAKMVVAETCLQMDQGFIDDVAEGVAVDPFRSVAKQSSSRAALSDAHPILQIDPHQSLVVTCTSMATGLGVCDLVKAWKAVHRADSLARLWIIGEDSGARKVWKAILEHDLVYTAIMPGFFDHLGEIFQAADLYVHPTRVERPCCLLSAARAHGVCTIATETDDGLRDLAAETDVDLRHQPFVERPGVGLMVPRQSPQTLAETINFALANQDFRTRVGNQSRKAAAVRVADRPPADQYLKPFLDARQGPMQPTQSRGAASADSINLPSTETQL